MIATMRSESKYFRPFKVPANSDQAWTNNINGVVLLGDLFNELSCGRVQFDKTDHSVRLTEWVVRHAPDDLSEILTLLLDLLSEHTDAG